MYDTGTRPLLNESPRKVRKWPILFAICGVAAFVSAGLTVANANAMSEFSSFAHRLPSNDSQPEPEMVLPVLALEADEPVNLPSEFDLSSRGVGGIVEESVRAAGSVDHADVLFGTDADGNICVIVSMKYEYLIGTACTPVAAFLEQGIGIGLSGGDGTDSARYLEAYAIPDGESVSSGSNLDEISSGIFVGDTRTAVVSEVTSARTGSSFALRLYPVVHPDADETDLP